MCGAKQDFAMTFDEFNSKVKDSLFVAKCDNCSKTDYFRLCINTPEILGGTNGYLSAERYWSKNPQGARRHEERIKKIKEDRRNRAKKLGITDRVEGPDRDQSIEERLHFEP
jgi:hypothetical protein